MTTYYFDSVNGLDVNAGTDINLPKQYYDNWNQGSTVAGDKFLFKYGTEQLITTANKSLIGGSATSVVYYGAYGNSQLPRPKFITTNTATGIFNQSRRTNYVVENLHFDMERAEINSLYISAMSLGAVTNVTINNCLFENAGGDYPGLYIGRENSAFQTTNVVVKNCTFRNNGADGITVLACNNVRVINCIGYDNGTEGPNGGHNFRITSRKVTVTSGWTVTAAPGGTTYSRALAAYELDVYFVYTPTYPRMTKTTGTTPAAGEFSVSGGLLYINNGANPSGVSITYVWDACYGVSIEYCESYRSLWNTAAPFQEGHGISFDDFASDCAIIGCRSFDNEGLGISINGGDRNRVYGNVLFNNEMRAIAIGSGVDNKIYNNTMFKNNQGRGKTTAEISCTSTASGSEVKNNIIHAEAGQTYGIYFDVATSCIADNNIIYNCSDTVFGGTETNTSTVNPFTYIESTGRLKLYSSNPLRNMGTYIRGVNLKNGRARPDETPVGAYQIGRV